MFANGFVVAVLLSYFTKPLLAAFQDRFHHSARTMVQGIILSEIVLCVVKDGVDFKNGRLL
jgi:hypothetical protein